MLLIKLQLSFTQLSKKKLKNNHSMYKYNIKLIQRIKQRGRTTQQKI